MSCKDLGRDLMQRYVVKAITWKLYHSRRKAIDLLTGSVKDHYAKLRRYVLELSRADKEGRFELHVEVGAVFKAMCIGFSGLRRGFKEGCRRMIGLDGAFLKTYLGGILLSAVRTYGNNQMYPIAWAIVEVENEVCWTWFINILVQELNLGEGVGITIISDQQKTHICQIGRKSKGPKLKQLFRKLVRSTYRQEYALACKELKSEDGQAFADLMAKNPSKFCKAFLTTTQCSDSILNNVCECFNAYILEARNKHIIEMLEEIRTTLMERLYRKAVEIASAGRGNFEVTHFDDRFVVTPSKRHCGCRKWDITGIPCLHAVNGEKLWPVAEVYPVTPPPVRKMPGRLKKVRRRDPFEKDPDRPNRLRKICVMTCQNCFQEGHNSRTCKNEIVRLLEQPKQNKLKNKNMELPIPGRAIWMKRIMRLRSDSLNECIHLHAYNTIDDTI
ncbi:uncharacterized protein LOC125189985 [Salvia hispanica]|uniref:uncharacterized protein LOC125189985 n=1 Tax=Salvia hispanica TaxID=49212 RepID=UPI0020098B4B|nr:uncharacterized protein LOC125189985 [Salvia hispanica]